MKIWVDASISHKNKEVSLIPVLIISESKEIEDVNEKNEILFNKNTSTSFLSPARLDELLDPKEQNIVLTIPKTLSGQFQSYKMYDFKNNVVILEGTAAFNKFNELIDIVKNSKNLEHDVNELNDKVEYYGFLLSASNINVKKRIGSIVGSLLTVTRGKICLHFKSGKWNKCGITVNVLKKMIKIIESENKKWFIYANEKNEKVCKYIKKIKEQTGKDIKFKEFTNSMKIHSGNDFIVIG